MSISNWNKIPSVKNARLIPFSSEVEYKESTCIRGNGRSYGDASLNARIISMINCKEVLDLKDDILHVSSGFTLGEVLQIVLKQDFLFPVITGTQFVTIGGMIGCDVHGKNHKRNGTIGSWVEEIELKIPSGEVVFCSELKNKELFRATIGGLGLTGAILSAKIKLEKLKSKGISQDVTEYKSIEELLTGIKESTSPYKVAWLDLARKNSTYFLLSGDFNAKSKNVNFKAANGKISIPNIGVSYLNKISMGLYNRLYTRRLRKEKDAQVSFSEFFFPLDKMKNWNNVYGSKGFYQYQFILPEKIGAEGMKIIIDKIRASKFTSYLSTLKYYGEVESPGIISFPIEGYSLTVDFKNNPGIVSFLRELDQLVIQFGGRVYLAKDAILTAENFRKMYSTVDEYKSVIKSVNSGEINSLMSNRLKLVDA